MRDLLILAVPLLLLSVLGCLWRAISLFGTRLPAAAVVWSTDYSEEEQHDDRYGLGLLRGWHPLLDRERSRLIDEVVHFDDVNGHSHVASVKCQVRRGRRPPAARIIWYDPRDPTRVTASGPGQWLLMALLLLCALGGVVGAGMKLPH